jgi:hypothetical protein
MTEIIKREVSLGVLKVRLLDSSASSAPASGSAPTANQTLTPNQRIFCELQVTGKAEERGFVAPTAESAERVPSRSKRRSNWLTYETQKTDGESMLSRTLAQWSFAPEEMQLPVDYGAAMQFRDKPNIVWKWLADGAHLAVTKSLSEIYANSLERFASGVKSWMPWLPSGEPMLPTTMMQQLSGLLPSILREGDSLWLELAEPAGYLPLLPWEGMLRPVTHVPILRLSPHVVQALSSDRELSVVLCISVPSDKCTPTAKQLASLMDAVRRVLPERSTVHVFADDLCHPLARTARDQVAASDLQGRVIKLYDLPERMSNNELLEKSWKNWVVESMAGGAVDILHSVAEGRLCADDARLVISRDPRPSEKLGKASLLGRPLHYMTPFELSDCLTRLGAWAVVFSTPSEGSRFVETRLGLRLLADQIARLRPGVVVFHDFEADPLCKALAESYKFMIGDPSIRASTSPAVSVYCHPARAMAEVAGQPMTVSNDLTQQYLKVKEMIRVASGHSGPTPAWVASTERIIEQAMSRAVGQDGKDDEAVTRGLVAAFKYVEQMLANPPRARTSSENSPTSLQAGEKDA